MSNQTINGKIKFSRWLLTLLFVAMSSTLLAQKNLTGRWLSKSINEGTEEMKMEFIFKDSVKMEMAFITDNKIPNVGRCLSRISIQGTYEFAGPLFFTEIDNNTLNVKIQKLELAGELAKSTPPNMIPTLKEALQQQMIQSAIALFAGYDGGSMIYVSHTGRDDVFSFIIGDEKNAMDLEFTRQ